jgi:hypothetical protein
MKNEKKTLNLNPTILGKTFSKNQSTLVYSIIKIDFILIHYGKLLPFEFDKINDVMMKPYQS